MVEHGETDVSYSEIDPLREKTHNGAKRTIQCRYVWFAVIVGVAIIMMVLMVHSKDAESANDATVILSMIGAFVLVVLCTTPSAREIKNAKLRQLYEEDPPTHIEMRVREFSIGEEDTLVSDA